MNKMYRQGDLMFKQIDSLSKGLKAVKNGVILHSDTTQHTHVVKSGLLYQDKDKKQYIQVKKMAAIVHEEHKPISLSKGAWEVRRQRQYLSKNMTALIQD